MNKRIVGALGACITLLLAGLLSAGPASADTPDVYYPVLQLPDPLCIQALALGAPGNGSNCIRELDTSVSDPTPATGAALASNADMAQAATTSAVYCRRWDQTEHGIFYYNWSETHSGKFCYTHTDVWIFKYGGYHTCAQGSGVLYSVNVTKCSENIDYTQQSTGGYMRQNHDYYQVHVAAKGVPIYHSYHMWVNVWPGGSVTGHWD